MLPQMGGQEVSFKCPGQRDSRDQGGDDVSVRGEPGRRLQPRPRKGSDFPLNAAEAHGRKRLAARQSPAPSAAPAPSALGFAGTCPGRGLRAVGRPALSCQPQLATCPSDPPSSLKMGLTAPTSRSPHRAQPAAFLPNRTLPPSLRMPEGPELHLASQFVNEACRALVFGGCVEKSSVSRNPEVPFESSAYRISASAGSKELRLILSPLPGAQPPQEPLVLFFCFGMSGSFQLVPREQLPRHAHLRFYTAPPGPRLALCFVDIRRFGHWDLGGKWQPGRGPCVLQEYQQFRVSLCCPGWSTVAPSQLIAASTSRAQVILSSQPPE
ncbi:uncharacterized protein [Symphalangus syndactylus]|uniref:uncharacterized protein isoform X2 n=1 Tax=Symphalangus syndactylus TaxID=9590 RepID=UPI003007B27A